MNTYLLSLLILLVQAAGIFLRYLPFNSLIKPAEKLRLWRLYTIFLIVDMLVINYIFSVYGISLFTYKMLIFAGALGFFSLNLLIIRKHFSQHMFILAMQSIYTNLMHGVAASILLALFPNHVISEQLIIHSLIYLLVILLTIYPLLKPFQTMFTIYPTANNKYYWQKIWLLPFFLAINDLFLIISADWIENWQELASRLLLALSGIVIYQSLTLHLKGLAKQLALDAYNNTLKIHVHSMNEQAALIDDSSKKIRIIRHDMRHQLNLLYALIKTDNSPEALATIEKLATDLDKTQIQTYCRNIVINSVLSVYLSKAARLGITVDIRLDLPKKLTIDENDMAIVVANLFENAINASKKQPAEERSIKIISRCQQNIMALSIANKFTPKVIFNNEGLPTTTEHGHGIGMQSVIAFREKYQATVLCSQADGWFTTNIMVTNKI